MKLSTIKSHLSVLNEIAFQLPDGTLVPRHFHVTEVGKVTKHFIDCGGTIRHEEVANFQLWDADDYDHRLHPEKLIHIISLSEKVLGLGDLEIEVEFQGTTIQKFGLDFDGTHFILVSKETTCLAREACGVPEQTISTTAKPKRALESVQAASSCTPGSGCC